MVAHLAEDQAAGGPAEDENGSGPSAELNLGERLGLRKQIPHCDRARHGEDLLIETVKKPAERGNDEHEPVVPV